MLRCFVGLVVLCCMAGCGNVSNEQNLSGGPTSLSPEAQSAADAVVKAIDKFQRDSSGVPYSLNELVERQYLEQIPRLPAGYKFEYDPFTGRLEVEGADGSVTVRSASATARASVPAQEFAPQQTPQMPGLDQPARRQPGAGGGGIARFDTNGDGKLDISDAIHALSYLFGAGSEPACLDGTDANDDGTLDVADAITILGHLFGSTGPLPPPFTACGRDLTEDVLTCRSYPPCP